SFAGIIAQEDCRAAKFLASLPEVDPAKVACVGFSMGGFRAWQLAAISDDISAGISVCWIGTMKDHIVADDGQLKGNSAFSMLHPTIAKYLDYPDVAGLAAPKAMYFISGDRDAVNPVEGTNNAYAKMRKIWQANGADDKLVTTMNAGLTHSFPEEQQKRAFDWLDTVFK
ncbi:MAG: dienelactone hydrolase family protein, partial [Treponemataceae bacterium]|nr:dienelactone hydrolase family protein [Treponemataceae bacterium]